MSKFNISTETVGKVIKGGLNVAVGLLVLTWPSLIERSVTVMAQPACDVKYSDAVRVIMNSIMLSSYKEEALGILKRDGDAEYYKSVIMVIESNSLSSTKMDMMRKLSEK